METRAQLNRVRLAPRKVRAVADLVKNKDVLVALDQLEHLIRRPAPQLIKLIKSGLANAENNFQMVKENLYIKNILVDEGIKLKRYMPRAQGRATEIQKKTSSITVIFEERVAGMRRKATSAKKSKEPVVQDAEPTVSETKGKPQIKQKIGQEKGLLGGLKKVFQRKAV